MRILVSGRKPCTTRAVVGCVAALCACVSSEGGVTVRYHAREEPLITVYRHFPPAVHMNVFGQQSEIKHT